MNFWLNSKMDYSIAIHLRSHRAGEVDETLIQEHPEIFNLKKSVQHRFFKPHHTLTALLHAIIL
jgi:hypothetical protein